MDALELPISSESTEKRIETLETAIKLMTDIYPDGINQEKTQEAPKPEGVEDEEGKKHFTKKEITKMIEEGLSVEQIKAIVDKADAESQKTLRHIFWLQWIAKIVETIVTKVASTWKISIIFTFLTIAIQRLSDDKLMTVVLAVMGLAKEITP